VNEEALAHWGAVAPKINIRKYNVNIVVRVTFVAIETQLRRPCVFLSTYVELSVI